MSHRVQPLDAENRTSAGVGGWRRRKIAARAKVQANLRRNAWRRTAARPALSACGKLARGTQTTLLRPGDNRNVSCAGSPAIRQLTTVDRQFPLSSQDHVSRPLRYDTDMPFTIDEAFLPATLTAPPMTDQQFAEFCAEHPDLFFETTAEGEIVVMPPTFSMTSARNGEIGGQLKRWAAQDGRGIVCESSGGFVLPNGARRSPDASWIAKDEIRKLDEESLQGYWHLCPAFVIELRSKSDRLPAVRAKMQEYIANGARLGWMIDPEIRTVEVYRPGREPELLAGGDSVAGEGPVEGFVLDLRNVWDPLAG